MIFLFLYYSLIMANISDLAFKHRPIVYFTANEPYLPVDFDEILNITNLTRDKLSETKLIIIPKDKRSDLPLAKQILCKTKGEFTYAGISYIDLVYIVIFTWNGTKEPHAFDKEEIRLRLKFINNQWIIDRIFGSSHGNGMWFKHSKNDIEFDEDDNNRPIMYSAFESHAMYNKPRTYKRIFGFGNDITKKDKKWIPTQVVFFDENNQITLIDENSTSQPNLEYFKYDGLIGDNKDTQEWPGSIDYNTLEDADGYYKYQGGIDNLFTGHHKKISNSIRTFVKIVCIIAWIFFVGYVIFRDVLDYKTGLTTRSMLIWFIIGHILIIGGLFISGSYLGLEAFVLNN